MGITISERFILASASPRRVELLKLMGLDFEVMPANIDEAVLPGETPREHVLRLSEEKALFVAHRHPDAWVLGADTIVIVAGEVLGKPGSVAEAKEMLEKLSGRAHEVFTGFCIIRQDQGVRIQEVVGSAVLFRKIAPDEMAWYTSLEEPYDKAGAYAIQGMGAFFIREIRGSWTNVMGLPLCEVVDALKRVRAINFSGGGGKGQNGDIQDPGIRFPPLHPLKEVRMKLHDLFRLSGKVALVTGGGRGIGKFIATGLAEAGADLILTSRKMKNLEATAQALSEGFGIKVLPIACDMANPEMIDAMLRSALEKFPRIDILVNNAGATWGAPTLEFPLEKWDQLFNVNVRGVWVLTQKVANLMKNQGGGNIINISSIMGFRGSEELLHPAVPYNSTKAAINLLTMNLAVKLAPYKIRVNAIAPGFFRTDMMAYIEKPEFKAAYDLTLASIPLGRIGDCDDMKGLAVFLASDASAYMTGQILVNDGGLLAK